MDAEESVYCNLAASSGERGGNGSDERGNEGYMGEKKKRRRTHFLLRFKRAKKRGERSH